MIELKNNFNGGLNLDDSPYLIPNNSYINALNVTRDAIAGSNDRAITNIVGNQQISYSFPVDNIITVSADVVNQDGTTFVTLTFNGANFIPIGWNVKLYVGDGASPDINIAEYTTVSTITVNQLLLLIVFVSTGGMIAATPSDLLVNSPFTIQFSYFFSNGTLSVSGIQVCERIRKSLSFL